jgi:hypothetical protein
MSLNLILATLFSLGGALDTLVRAVSGLVTAAFLMLADIWVIVVVILGTIIIIIVIVIRTSRRQ